MSNPNAPWPPAGIPPQPPVPEGWTDADYDEPPPDPPLLRAVRYWALVARFGGHTPPPAGVASQPAVAPQTRPVGMKPGPLQQCKVSVHRLGDG